MGQPVRSFDWPGGLCNLSDGGLDDLVANYGPEMLAFRNFAMARYSRTSSNRAW
jgi:hypothetical protein